MSDIPKTQRAAVYYSNRDLRIEERPVPETGPGELLVSEDALQACADRRPEVRLQPVGPASVRGVQEPIWLHRYVG